jgi:outer membrane protein assembly factor BamB
MLNCLDAATGNVIWRRDVFQDAGVTTAPQWGLSTSPVIFDDLVVVYAGGKEDKSLFAYEASTGEPRWHVAGGSDSYSSVQPVVFDGETQALIHDNLALRAVSPADGKLLWEHSHNGVYFSPMIQPHALGDHELLVSLPGGVTRLDLSVDGDAVSTKAQWESTKIKPEYNDFVVHEDYLYGLDDGILCCIDVANGQRKWKKGRYGHGQILLLPAAGQLLVISEQGEGILVAADPKEHRELGKAPLIEGKTWNHPTVVNGRLYVRNAEEMACYQLKLGDTSAREQTAE